MNQIVSPFENGRRALKDREIVRLPCISPNSKNNCDKKLIKVSNKYFLLYYHHYSFKKTLTIWMKFLQSIIEFDYQNLLHIQSL